MRRHVELLSCDSCRKRDIDELLSILGDFARALLSPDLGWIDVMTAMAEAGPEFDRLIDGLESSSGWLRIAYSGTVRTSRPIAIPLEVNGEPWRGSATAFASNGVDYIGSFRGVFSERYALPCHVIAKIEAKYDYWRRESFFGALLAISIPSPDDGDESIGVLNLNFLRENPLPGILEPGRLAVITNFLQPTIVLLSQAIHGPPSGDREWAIWRHS
jgi:hypothetical protein